MGQSAYVDALREDDKVEVEDQEDIRLDLVAQRLETRDEYVAKTDDIGPTVERPFDSGKAALVQIVTDTEVSWCDAPTWDKVIT